MRLDHVHELLPDELLLDRVLKLHQVPLHRHEGVAGEVAGIPLDLDGDVRVLPEEVVLPAVLGCQEVEKFSVEDVQERGDIRVFSPLKCDTAEKPFLDELVVLRLVHIRYLHDLHRASSYAGNP
ncbi:hypothetical protein DSECCO2_578630 [anaerobic digester metagenome]